MGSINGKYVLNQKDLIWFENNTLIRREDVIERYQGFLKAHPDGRIPKGEFIGHLEACYGKRKNYKGLEKYIYETYDMNADGWVDFKEFLCVLYTLSNDSPKEKLELIFRAFDIQKTGVLVREEVNQIVKDFFHLLDNPQKTRPIVLADIAFREMDLNKDKKVTKDEFVNACLRNDRVCTMICSKILEIANSDCAQ